MDRFDDLTSLTPEQRDLLLKRLAERTDARADDGRIPRRKELVDQAPISVDQQFWWFLQSVDSDGSAYHMPLAVRLRGALDYEILSASFTAQVRRHEVLRTTFPMGQEGPVQRIHSPPDDVEWQLHDLSRMEEPEAEAWKHLRQAVATAIDLAEEFPFRLFLFKLADDDHVVLSVFHHIAVDAWTARLLFDELRREYEARVAGRQPDIAESSIRFADFAAWEQERLEGPEFAEGMKFWRQHLSGGQTEVLWPFDALAGDGTERTGRLVVRWADALTRRLRRVATEQRATAFVCLHAMFAAFIARYIGQTDVTIGIPVAKRDRPELQHLIGCLINTVPARSQVNLTDDFRSWVDKAKRGWSEIVRHQWIPLATITREIYTERHTNPTALFDILLTYFPGETPTTFGNLQMEPFDAGAHAAPRVALDVTFHDAGDALDVELIFDRRRISLEGARRLASAFERFAEGCLVEPGRPMAAHEVLRPEERLLIGRELSPGPVVAHESLTVNELFARQVARRPDAPALLFDGGQWTYRELDQRVDRIARRLRAVGVGPETTVGVSARRSPELVAALFGVLRAGGAYVALAPELPAKLLRHMAKNSGLRHAVCDAAGAASLGEIANEGLTPLLLEDAFEDREGGPDIPQAEVWGDHLAYILYTSGTTGLPKGVCIQHGALAHLAQTRDHEDYEASDITSRRFLFASQYTFDMSVAQLFPSLCQGAAVAVPPPGIEREPRAFVEWLAAHDVTDIELTPTHLKMLAQAGTLSKARSLRRINTGGEALDRGLCQMLFAQVEVTLRNLYGPTEMCNAQTVKPITSSTELDAMVSIGRPLPNFQVHLLDQYGNPKTVGCAGSLCIAGPGEARGYARQPRETAAKFIPCPNAGRPGERTYVTGDVAYWSPDGDIEYLGREDDQLQVRGIRVELGAIETHLESLPEVVRAAVGAPGALNGRADALVAWVKFAAGERLEPAEMQAHLREYLEEAVIPSQFVTVEEMPLSPSGKIDRRALPDAREQLDGREREIPQNETQRRIAAVWLQHLDRDRVGIHDNFFEIGGHSLLAIRIQSGLEASFGFEFPIGELIARPTISELESYVIQREAEHLSEDDLQAILSEVLAWNEGLAVSEPARNPDVPQQQLARDTGENTGQQAVASAMSGEPDPRRIADTETARQPPSDLESWARGPQVGVWGKPVHRLFEAQTRKHPDGIALRFGDSAWTYEHLNRAANRFARRLQALGVRQGALVGVGAERTPELVAALLGILKAGGAYVALEPSLPPQRLAYMCEDADVRLIVADSAGSAALSGHETKDLQTLLSDGVAEDDLVDDPDAASLAYVLYTSGTTGRPKGVMIPHRALTNVSQTYARTIYGLDAGNATNRVFMIKASYTFDMFVAELFPPLIAGACVAIAPPRSEFEPHMMHTAIRQFGVTDLWATPTALKMLLVASASDGPVGLSAVYAGGEALSEELCHRLQERWRCQIWNLYGPTEMCIGQTASIVRVDSDARGIAPIGGPTANHVVHVLDASLEPTSGEGELAIAGFGEARGYLAMPRRTAEAFVPCHFGDGAGSRMYLTGDVGQWMADGRIQFLGRLDNQLQVRGVRVEIDEIETHLRGAAGVRNAAVRPSTVSHGRADALVAYVVLDEGNTLDVVALRRHLLELLPEPVVPARFVQLREMPTTPSGKLDRDAVADPTLHIGHPQTVEPRTATEAEIAAIWCEHMELDHVGVDENFFAVGGHSLAAVLIQGELAKRYDVNLSLRELFESPTIGELAAILEGRDGAAAGIERRHQGDDAPLSADQLRMWFLQKLEPDGAAYNEPVAFRLEGQLDAEALRRAFGTLQDRHEILRTLLVERPDGPVQHILPEGQKLSWEFVHLSPTAECYELARRHIADRCAQPFILSEETPLRVSLIRTREDEHILLLLFHHVAVDEWTLRVVLEELAALYDAEVSGRPAVLHELPIQYADYAIWQAEQLAGTAAAKSLSYWRDSLRGARDRMEWPFGTEQRDSHPGGLVEFQWGADLARSVRELAREAGTTVFVVLHAILAAYLAQLTGQRDLTIGLPATMRQRPELQHLVGLFLNTIPMRSRISSSMSFSDWLGESSRHWQSTLEHQWVPLEEIVRSVGADRPAAGLPLFDVIFTYVPSTPIPEYAGLTVSSFDPGPLPTAKNALTVLFADAEDGLGGRLEFDAGQFEHAAMERLAGELSRFATCCVTAPGSVMAAHESVGSAERAHVDRCAQGPKLQIDDQPVHRRFEAQARLHPDRVALVLENAQWTYRELNKRANRIANRLLSSGVSARTSIGLSIERSGELVAALLGVLKAGAMYVPLEPNLPARRLDYMREDAAVEVVVADAAGRARLPDGVAVLPIEELLAEAPELEDDLPRDPEPLDLAYILYTSGTTGRPKGVMIHHRAIVNHAESFARTICRIADEDDARERIFLLKASYSFDLFVSELFIPLITGARVVVVPPGGELDPHQLHETIRAHGVTDLWATPTNLKMLEIVVADANSSLAVVYSAGEALTSELVKTLRQRWGVTVWNLYGPTEMCAGQIGGEVAEGDSGRPGASIGVPTGNHTAHVFSPTLELRPTGTAGEIAISGTGEARGYCGMPRRTAERFVPSPVAQHAGSRMYLTGDVGRWNHNGTLDYLGRLDDQLQIRGVRVELEEIEALLNEARGVVQAAVRPVNPFNGRADALVAYVVLEADTQLDSATLRAFLLNGLPEAVVPSRYVQLSRMPTTPSGKVDRKALPEPQDEGRSKERVAPRDELETLIAAVWRRHLDLDDVGIYENLFEIGGHSLLAVRIQHELSTELGQSLPLRLIFDAPTIAEFAQRWRDGDHEDDDDVPPIERAEYGEEVPLSADQRGLWFLQKLNPSSSAYHVPCSVFLEGHLDEPNLRRAVERFVQRHEVLRTLFPSRDGEPVQKILSNFALPWTYESLEDLADPRSAAAQRARSATDLPFDLEREIPFRALLFRLAPQEHVLLLLFHHIAIDHWTIDLVIDEVKELYESEWVGRASTLPQPGLQYADYAIWQREALKHEWLQEGIARWRDHLHGAVDEVRWPIGLDRPVGSDVAGYVDVAWEGEQARLISEFATRTTASPFVVFLSAFTAFLSRVSGQRDVTVGIPVTMRRRPELQRMVGMLLNTVPTRTQWSAGTSFASWVAHVEGQWREMMPWQWIPLDRIVQEVGARRVERRMPLFDVIFTYVPEVGETVARFGDLVATPFEIGGLAQPKASLSFLVSGSQSAFRAGFEYNAARFAASEIEEMARQFQTFLRSCLVSPNVPMGGHAVTRSCPVSPDEAQSPRRLWASNSIRDVLTASRLPSQAVRGAYVLDPLLDACATGFEGELFLSIDNAAVPQDSPAVVGRILPDSFGTAHGAVLLGTTMRARASEDGSIEVRSTSGNEEHGVDQDHPQNRPLNRLRQCVEHLPSDLRWLLLLKIRDRQPRRAQVVRSTAGAVQPRGQAEFAPLSADQRRLWFLQRLQPSSAAYHVPLAVQFAGSFDSEAMREAVRELVARHEVLRTIFPEQQDGPVQRILPPDEPIAWETLDVSQEPDPVGAAAEQVRARVGTPFDLAAEPPLRVTVLRTGVDRHVLLILFHHIAIDEWTTGLAMGELRELYQSRIDRRESRLPVPRLQYADYAIWQAEQLAGELLSKSVAYWQAELHGARDHIEWPFGVEPPAGNHPAGHAEFIWKAALTEPLRAIARSHGTTLFTVLHAAFAAFLARLTGQADLTVGVPVTMRHRSEFQGLVGVLLNTVPLRSQVPLTSSFGDWLGHSAERWRLSTEHHWVPLETIVQSVVAKRGPGALPLFDVMFTYVPGRMAGAEFAGLVLEPFDFGQLPEAKAALSVSFGEDEDGSLAGAFEFDAARFDAATIGTMVEQFEQFVGACVRSPGAPMAGHRLVDGHERRKLDAWAQGQPFETPQEPFHRLFERVVEDHPDRAAIVSEAETWDYRELNRRANLIAGQLIEAGVRPETRVGISMERSPALIAAIVGTLKSGGAYVALEPSLPIDRLRYMSNDSGVEIILCDSGAASLFHDMPQQLISIEDVFDDDLVLDNPSTQLEGDNLAYVLYTSGTTGSPKGVMISHRALAGISESYARIQRLGDTGREGVKVALVKASYTFDMFVGELFPALTAGATVSVLPQGAERDPRRFSSFIRDHRVTDLWATPTALRLLLEGDLDKESSLELVISGGEALTCELASLVRERWGVELWNFYGPTEMCVGQTYVQIGDSSARGVASIGRPTPGHRVSILDAVGEPRPCGADGHIVISGFGESRGYCNMARRNAQSFLPSPGPARGARMYFTGDVGRWDEFGEILYRGRSDDQLQVRGVRIEPPEVESHLETAPGVVQAAVRAINVVAGRADQLVAYVVMDTNAALNTAAIRSHLAQHLHETAIPGVFIELDAMPRNPAGKIDKRALPDPDQAALPLELTAPSTTLERAIADIWVRALGVPTVGIHQDFFEIGGHSLLAVAVQRMVRETLEVELPLDSFFRYPTIAELAALIDRLQSGDEPLFADSGDVSVVPLAAGAQQAPIVLFHPIGGNLLGYRSLVSSLDSASIWGVRAPAEGDVTSSLEHLVARYLEELEDRAPLNDCTLVGWSFGGVLAFEAARQLRQRGVVVRHLLLIDSWSPEQFRRSKRGVSELEEFILDVAGTLGIALTDADEARRDLREIEPARRFKWLAAQMAARGLPAHVADPAGLAEMFTTFRSNLRRYADYVPERVSVPATVVSAGGMGASSDRGWDGLLEGRREVVVDADHFGVMRPPKVQVIARIIKQLA